MSFISASCARPRPITVICTPRQLIGASTVYYEFKGYTSFHYVTTSPNTVLLKDDIHGTVEYFQGSCYKK